MQETPHKQSGQQKEFPQTGVKEQQGESYKESRGPQSQYQEEPHGERRERDPEEVMNEIQKEIKNVEGRLQHIQSQKRKHDQESEEYKSLDDQRRVLRKELVQLDYQHRLAHAKSKKNKRQSQESAAQQGQKQQQKAQNEQSKAKEQYQARIRALTAQLQASQLRRSRQIQLEAELATIRSLTPDYWYGYYYRPYYLSLYDRSFLYPTYLPYRYYRDPLYDYSYRYYRDPLYPYSLYPYAPYI